MRRRAATAALRASIFAALACACLVAAAIAGCSEAPYGSGAQRYRIPWPDAATGEYRLQTVTIQTFDHPESMEGRWAKIFVAPYVVNGELSGGSPVGRFVRDRDGVLHPADTTTRQATTVYAHMERLRALDAFTGGDSALRWPARVGVRTRATDAKGDLLDSALYDGGLDAVLIVPFDQPNALSIPYNSGVLAHEHFHALFAALVQRPIALRIGRNPGLREGEDWAGVAPPPVPLRAPASSPYSAERAVTEDSVEARNLEANDFLLRGINEGFADFWGWVYSGDAVFVGRSLAILREQRRLDAAPGTVPTIEAWQSAMNAVRAEAGSSRVRRRDLGLGYAYLLGAQYGRLLRQAALDAADGRADEASRWAAGRALIGALPAFAESVRETYLARQPIDPRAGAVAFARALPSAKLTALSAACVLFEKSLPGFARAESAAGKTTCAAAPSLTVPLPGALAREVAP